jgi:acetyl-CoA carboxylase biotin carboxyl carrier protein
MAGKRKDEPAGGLDDVREILDLLEERGISEFELEKNGFRIRIKREAAREGSHHAAPVTHFETPHPSPPLGASSAAQAATPSAEPPKAEENLHMIKSPIVGTFYASPSPDAPPFVKAGDLVQTGQTLCIIEAMKLMNEIEAEVAGEIARIFVESGQPVEYGQSLFAIIPSSSP